ncbi:hypothetical protein PENANT_c042G04413 [Penicillium antarcticum]|uniref:Uncharacterized protein n=1 Tax=Penicillium antarcticum TaxID=416450 RepID=A0A1V6PSK0_9EURO|nr:hypothetical protein PENANT_c042G04413 [Penicillium antarcticum]
MPKSVTNWPKIGTFFALRWNQPHSGFEFHTLQFEQFVTMPTLTKTNSGKGMLPLMRQPVPMLYSTSPPIEELSKRAKVVTDETRFKTREESLTEVKQAMVDMLKQQSKIHSKDLEDMKIHEAASTVESQSKASRSRIE